MRATATLLNGVLAAALAASGAVSQEQEQKAPAAPQRVGGEIKEPKKLKNVPPVYPEEAKRARVQGVVILECTISPEGTVADVRVLRGIPLLDQAAVDAVKQWVYTPTLLAGKPVPVIMTVTVNFRLSVGSPLTAGVEAPAPAPVPTGSPEKIADIRRFLELNGSVAAVLKTREMMLASLRALARPETPAEIWEALRADIEAEHFEDSAVFLYDKYFTHDEIRDYIRFYETPAGRKLGATQPVLAQAQLTEGAARAPRLMRKLVDRLRSGGYLKQ
jgi:TonB family protein